MFIGNEQDNNHCMQAVYMMMVWRLSGRAISMDIAERETGWVEGLPTWQYNAALGLANRGMSVVSHEFLDIDTFKENAGAALQGMLRDDSLCEQWLASANIGREQEAVRAMSAHSNVSLLSGIPTVEDLVEVIRRGGFALCNVNGRALHGLAGYSGHFVLVTQASSSVLVVQDPGLPPSENLTVSRDQFERAWYYPHSQLGNYVAAFSEI